MIHTLRQSPKFMRLVRKLRPLANGSIIDADSIATAVLERLWHATTTGAMRGDIGRYENDVIAEMCGWLGDADQLIAILIETAFLDEDSEHRLLVHDWQDHAPNHVKGNVTKVGGFFEAQPLGPSPRGPSHRDGPEDVPLGTGAPNLTNPNLTQPNPTKPKSAAKSPRYPDEFELFWETYPTNSKGRKRGKHKSFAIWKTIDRTNHAELLEATKNYAAEETEFVRDPERFLKAEWWREMVGEAKVASKSEVQF